MKTELAIILSLVSLAYARAGEQKHKPAIKPSVVAPTPVTIVLPPQLNVDYPAITLANGRVLSDVRVASFDKKNLTFCIGHRQGIDAAIPWGAMPTAWQAAFPLVGADAQRGAEQITVAKKAPATSAYPNESEGRKTVVRRRDSTEESDPSASRKAQDLQTLDAAARIEDRRAIVRHYLENREQGFSQEEAGQRAIRSTEADRAQSSQSTPAPPASMHRSW